LKDRRKSEREERGESERRERMKELIQCGDL